MKPRPTTDTGIRPETLESIARHLLPGPTAPAWRCPFVLPAWLTAWWPHFSGNWEPLLLSVYHRGQVAGVAPLMRRGDEARLIGTADVCDHLDVVVAPHHGDSFGRQLLDALARGGIRRLTLTPVRGDSAVITHLLPAAERWGARISNVPEATLFAMPLPDSWQAYLQGLRGKERHEIRRKLRRLDAAGRVALRCIENAPEVPGAMETFLTLFRANRSDKAAFMSGAMPAFFRDLARNLAAAGLLRLYFLDLDGRAVAATFCIAHRSTVYLYNNGYDAAFRSLSVGLLSKVLTIQKSIAQGWQVYDFLKGEEVYKRRLGARPVSLHHCVFELDR